MKKVLKSGRKSATQTRQKVKAISKTSLVPQKLKIGLRSKETLIKKLRNGKTLDLTQEKLNIKSGKTTPVKKVIVDFSTPKMKEKNLLPTIQESPGKKTPIKLKYKKKNDDEEYQINLQMDASEDNKRPQRKIQASNRFGEYVADSEMKKTLTKQSKRSKKVNRHGWYRVNSISGHRIVKVKNHDQLDLKIFWEGYSDPSWEGFCGFVKDTPGKVERYLIKNQIRPYQNLRNEYRKLVGQFRKQSEMLRIIQNKPTLNSSEMTHEQLMHLTNQFEFPSVSGQNKSERRNEQDDSDSEIEYENMEKEDKNALISESQSDVSMMEEKEMKQNTHEPPIQAAVEMQRSGEDASTNKSSLSIEKQLCLAKYFYTNEIEKRIWRNIIIEIRKKCQNEHGINGNQARVINAATNQEMTCFIESEVLETRNEKAILKILSQQGLQLAKSNVKVYLLYKILN